MKLKRVKKPRNKLLQLQILKLRYKKKSYDFNVNLKQMEINLHKIMIRLIKLYSAHLVLTITCVNDHLRGLCHYECCYPCLVRENIYLKVFKIASIYTIVCVAFYWLFN